MTEISSLHHREQLPDQVAAYVRELIVTGEVKPGTFLRLEPIAEAMGVSNTPVREALVRLRNEGFLRLEPRRGFMVRPFAARDVRDLYWVTAQLAGELAARAASYASADDLDRIREAAQHMERSVGRQDNPATASHGHDFHRQVNLAARSDRLALLLQSVASHLPLRLSSSLEAQLSGTCEEHAQILKAMEDRDADGARELMVQHVSSGAERLIEVLGQADRWEQDGA
jgi:DNA-binding GntR family transcriptional regulator